MPTFSPLIDRALVVSATAHRNQVRKGSQVPYVIHPVHVALLLIRHQFPDEVIIAALLHDVVEDTSITLAELQAEFGEEVARLVAAVRLSPGAAVPGLQVGQVDAGGHGHPVAQPGGDVAVHACRRALGGAVVVPLAGLVGLPGGGEAVGGEPDGGAGGVPVAAHDAPGAGGGRGDRGPVDGGGVGVHTTNGTAPP